MAAMKPHDQASSTERDEAIAARLDRVAEIEAQIDPGLRRRGRVIADLVTLGVLVPLAIAFDLHVTHPFFMLALMGGALALNHLLPRVTERRLRRERKRLLAGAEAEGRGSERGDDPV